MNVTELARQLKTTKDELLEKLPKLGFDIGARAIKIDNRLAGRIKEAWAQGARTDRLKAKMDQQAAGLEEKEEKKELQKEINIGDKITVTDFATKLDTEVTHLIGYLMKNGIMATINQKLDFDTAEIIASELNVDVKKKEEEARNIALKEEEKAIQEAERQKNQEKEFQKEKEKNKKKNIEPKPKKKLRKIHLSEIQSKVGKGNTQRKTDNKIQTDSKKDKSAAETVRKITAKIDIKSKKKVYKKDKNLNEENLEEVDFKPIKVAEFANVDELSKIFETLSMT